MRISFFAAVFLGAACLPGPAAALAPSELPGTYQGIQRIRTDILQKLGIGPSGMAKGEGRGRPGLVGDPLQATLVLAANSHFTIDLGGFDEGRWVILTHEETGKQYLRFQGKKASYEALFQQEWGLSSNEIGIWKEEGGAWWMLQFRKVGQTGYTPPDLTEYTEAAMAQAFGKGRLQADFESVGQGSASGSRIQEGRFSPGTRFSGSMGAPQTNEQIALTFLPDGRFTVSAMLAGVSTSGIYEVKGNALWLQLEGTAKEEWQLARDKLSGQFLIRQKGTEDWLVEVSLR